MSKIIVFGAHGRVGQRLVQQLSKQSKYQATAVVRNAEQSKRISEIAGDSVATKQVKSIADLSVDELVLVVGGHKAIVLTVGSAGKDLLKVDLDGVVKTFEAAVKANIRRLVLVSAAYASSREYGVKSPIPNYYIAKFYADRILQNEFKDSLDYTILKPSLLTDGEGTGKIHFLKGEDAGLVDRADVALVILEILENPKTFGKSYDFKNGDTPISAESTWS